MSESGVKVGFDQFKPTCVPPKPLSAHFRPISPYSQKTIQNPLEVNKLKTTPTPNKNGSYGIKGVVRMPYFWGPYAVFSVEIP